jgi:hypothetical protein
MKLFATVLAAAALLALSVSLTGQPGPRGETPVPATPAAVRDILYSRPFTLQTPYRNEWSKERAPVSSGVLVVLDVDPALVVPRNALEPVLYAGNFVVQRLNHGDRSGRVIGIVPANVNLSNTLIWFGPPQLPERITEAMVRSERARAERAGLRPFAQARISNVQRPAFAAADLAALLRTEAAQLIEDYSPAEKGLADSWRLPTAKAAPKQQ